MNPGSTGNPSEPTSDPGVVTQPALDAGQYPGQAGAAPPPGWAPGYPGYPYVVRRPTNGMAIAALVTGIVALFSCQLVGGVAIYLAKKARTEIQASGEEGSGFATAGLVLGWVSLGLVALGLLFFLAYLGFMGVLFATTASTSG
ncbi:MULTISPECIES: DUF4190 domain-containing protein [unclassified Plantactinospora]|uniref:DUF4190 domain-containing protein n=1 Tax=unclassified Plantactinospora TaxID=2631981 RepID=UPI000D167C68|nr:MULTISPECIES: DUF4190 domain-containing protein [unclassified Plantactinospora]AVT30099.1 hypothetical protein C6361_11970 [Plantactinospora sp. BC1]AVT36612.1 hypothetical protein C6W10_09075 [Plantactinospora sp. BB1]